MPETTYEVAVIRHVGSAEEQVRYDGYGLLRELLDEIETECERRGWFKDDAEAVS